MLRAAPALSLQGKVALVTAATDGIGLAVAEALGVAGAQVLLSSRRESNVQRAVNHLRGRGLKVSGVTCHVGRAEERERMVQAALDTFGSIDILVSNAAVNPHLGPALEADEGTWEKVFQVNVTAAAMLVRLVVPHMERRGGGAIVLMSSITGYQPMAGRGHRADVIDRRVPANGGAGPVQRLQVGPAGAGGRPEPGAAAQGDPGQRRRPGADPDPLQPGPLAGRGRAGAGAGSAGSAEAGHPPGGGSGRAVPGQPPELLRGRADAAGGRGGGGPALTTPTAPGMQIYANEMNCERALTTPTVPNMQIYANEMSDKRVCVALATPTAPNMQIYANEMNCERVCAALTTPTAPNMQIYANENNIKGLDVL